MRLFADENLFEPIIDETLAIFKRVFNPLADRNVSRNLVIVSPEGVRIRRAGD